MPFNIESGYAIASNVDTPMQGLFCANAIPFTHATPMRTPVKEPGPAETANKIDVDNNGVVSGLF